MEEQEQKKTKLEDLFECFELNPKENYSEYDWGKNFGEEIIE